MYDVDPMVSVDVAYLDELYAKIESQKQRLDMLDSEMATLLEELASSRMKSRPRPPVYREVT